MAIAAQKREQTLTIWRQHLCGDSVSRRRLPASAINTLAAVAEPRLSHLCRVTDKANIIALVTLQIRDLIDFLNFKNTMNAEQIVDTAEIIIDEYYNLSLMGIQDCFNMIKKAKPPFNKELYQSIDGRKILEAIARYDQFMYEFLMRDAEEEAESNKRSAMDNPREFKRFKELLNKQH